MTHSGSLSAHSLRPWTRRAWLGAVAAGAAAAACGGAVASAAELPAQIDGLAAADGERVRELAAKFVEKYQLPSLSWAVAHRGKLKATAALGLANTADKTAATPSHLYRVASVSKPITAVAILKLVEEGSLDLGHHVFARNGLLRKFYDAAPLDPVSRGRLEAVTVQHLLEHTCGGWSNSKNDPMFVPAALGMNHGDLIRWTLRNAPLEQTPGTKYAYSNFGYCLLGRVIEALTDATYFEAMQRLVLKPAGITRMRIGQKNGNAEGEVRYYGKDSDPYGPAMDVARMDAHGGWIATPTDLVRLAVHVDGFDDPADLLPKSSLSVMTTPSSANDHYAKGWNVNQADNWWHLGGFPGGSAILVRIHEGDCWALLVNADRHEPTYYSDLDALGWNLRNSIQEWPEHDRFQG